VASNPPRTANPIDAPPARRDLDVADRRSAASDAEAYEKYSDELMRFATMLVGPSNAEDVVADAVLRVFASLSWETVANRRAYLYRALIAEASSAGRSTRRRLLRERRLQHATFAVLDGYPIRRCRAARMRRSALVDCSRCTRLMRRCYASQTDS
jgi:DNA-directed RNA polymerase specialized sigma24 family protein